jgi:Chlorophyll A-B binding protein
VSASALTFGLLVIVPFSELKHGRSAMIATVGYAVEKFGLTFDKISPHEYLSVTQNIKFADLAAMKPIDAALAIPAEGWAQVFGVIAAIEIYELTHRNGAIQYDETVAPGLQPGGLTGDLGWNPLQIKVTDNRRLVELQNGRAAMFAICAWVAAEAVPGSVPLPLLW